MTTPLIKPISREILIGTVAYIVTMTADCLSLRRKGTRTGIDIPWDELLTHGADAATITPQAPAASTAPPRAVLDGIAQQVRAAVEALGQADGALTQAGALPPELMRQLHGDPVHGRPVQPDYWFVEPLLTIAEVAQLLRVSTRAVRRLDLRTIRVGGEDRYQQSDIREYLRRLGAPDFGRRPRRGR